jgi:hypothetical protein
MSDNPITRFTLLLLFQAQQDHATELTIAPAIGERAPIRYKVQGNWYDFSPPPEQILPEVVAALERLAAFAHRPFPREGPIDVAYSGVRLHWIIRMASPQSDCVLTPVEP